MISVRSFMSHYGLEKPKMCPAHLLFINYIAISIKWVFTLEDWNAEPECSFKRCFHLKVWTWDDAFRTNMSTWISASIRCGDSCLIPVPLFGVEWCTVNLDWCTDGTSRRDHFRYPYHATKKVCCVARYQLFLHKSNGISVLLTIPKKLPLNPRIRAT